jgi:hypothetical protein
MPRRRVSSIASGFSVINESGPCSSRNPSRSSVLISPPSRDPDSKIRSSSGSRDLVLRSRSRCAAASPAMPAPMMATRFGSAAVLAVRLCLTAHLRMILRLRLDSEQSNTEFSWRLWRAQPQTEVYATLFKTKHSSLDGKGCRGRPWCQRIAAALPHRCVP